MPWQITSFSEVQHDFGKPLYLGGATLAPVRLPVTEVKKLR